MCTCEGERVAHLVLQRPGPQEAKLLCADDWVLLSAVTKPRGDSASLRGFVEGQAAGGRCPRPQGDSGRNSGGRAPGAAPGDVSAARAHRPDVPLALPCPSRPPPWRLLCGTSPRPAGPLCVAAEWPSPGPPGLRHRPRPAAVTERPEGSSRPSLRRGLACPPGCPVPPDTAVCARRSQQAFPPSAWSTLSLFIFIFLYNSLQVLPGIRSIKGEEGKM